jgi:hypothetical protein
MHPIVRRLLFRVLTVGGFMLTIAGAIWLIQFFNHDSEGPSTTVPVLVDTPELQALFGGASADIRVQIPASQVAFVKGVRDEISPLCLTLYRLNDPELPDEQHGPLLKETLRHLESCNARIDPLFTGASDWIARVEIDAKGGNCDFVILVAPEDLAQLVQAQRASMEFVRAFSADGKPLIYFTVTFRTPLSKLGADNGLATGDYVRFSASKSRPVFTMGPRALWSVNITSLQVIKKS